MQNWFQYYLKTKNEDDLFFNFPTKISVNMSLCTFLIRDFINQYVLLKQMTEDRKDLNIYIFYCYCFYREVFFTVQKVFNKSESCGFVCFGL